MTREINAAAETPTPSETAPAPPAPPSPVVFQNVRHVLRPQPGRPPPHDDVAQGFGRARGMEGPGLARLGHVSNSFFFPFSVTFSIDGRSRDTHETPARPSPGARSGGGAGEDRHPGQTLWAGAGVSREATAGRRQRGAGKGERTGGPGEPRGRALVSLSLVRAARGGDPRARAHLTQAGEAKGEG